MTRRTALILLLLTGCAAAVPAAHHVAGAHRASMHGGLHGPDGFRDRLERELDAMNLPADTRAKVVEVFDAHHAQARALMEKIHSGEIARDAAMEEHEKIVASAEDDLRPVLTSEQIRRLKEALHPEHRVK
jgi:Spy/CpxP family protein refolding chaperone